MLCYETDYNAHFLPHLEYLTTKVYLKKEALILLDTPAFNPKAQFLEGKIINALSYCIVHSKKSTYFQSIAPDLLTFLANGTYDTWGTLNALLGFLRLHEHGLLDSVLSDTLRTIFKEKLDHHTFIRQDDLTLINKPTNYYGVAFGIAAIRTKIGFDATNDADAIFTKLMHHITQHSNGNNYMDETNGDGRFDRYTLLVPAELINLCLLTGKPIPTKLHDMLQASCTIYYTLINDKGDGFPYGRSIGTYGDTSALEVLSVGCKMNLFSKEEQERVYTYCLHIAKKFQTTWYDHATHSINMWCQGRGTDSYRNINRVLGENLSLYLQITHAFEYFKQVGFDLTQPVTPLDTTQVSLIATYTFNEGTYTQKLYSFPLGNRTVLLPFINGAHKYYNATPYLPTPHLQRVFESSADSYHPNLIPLITLVDGRKLMPICYFSNITHCSTDDTLVITATLDTLCEITGTDPVPLEQTSGCISYRITPSSLHATFTFNTPAIAHIALEYATFSTCQLTCNTITFDTPSPLNSLTFEGLDEVTYTPINPNNTGYHTPHGALQTCIHASTQDACTSVGYHFTFA